MEDNSIKRVGVIIIYGILIISAIISTFIAHEKINKLESFSSVQLNPIEKQIDMVFDQLDSLNEEKVDRPKKIVNNSLFKTSVYLCMFNSTEFKDILIPNIIALVLWILVGVMSLVIIFKLMNERRSSNSIAICIGALIAVIISTYSAVYLGHYVLILLLAAIISIVMFKSS